MQGIKYEDLKIEEMVKKLTVLAERYEQEIISLRANRPSPDIAVLEQVARDRVEIYERQLILSNKAKVHPEVLTFELSKTHGHAKLLLKTAESIIRIGNADQMLREYGIPKPTESMREAALFIIKPLNDLRECVSTLNAQLESANKLEWQIRNDESSMKDLLTSHSWRGTM